MKRSKKTVKTEPVMLPKKRGRKPKTVAAADEPAITGLQLALLTKVLQKNEKQCIEQAVDDYFSKVMKERGVIK